MTNKKILICVHCGRKRDEHDKKEWHAHYMITYRRNKANLVETPTEVDVKQTIDMVRAMARDDNLDIFELSQRQMLTFIENSDLPSNTINIILKEYLFRIRTRPQTNQELESEIESLKKQIQRRNEFINRVDMFIEFGKFDDAQDTKEKEKESEVIEI